MNGLQALRSLPPADLGTIVGIPIVFVALFLWFLGICAIRGMPRSRRLDRTRMVPRVFLEYGYWLLHLPLRILRLLGVSPNTVTLFSLVFAAGSMVAVARGRFCLGGWMIWLSFIADGLDGLLARSLGVCSNRGEFFDAFVDRYADFLLLLGFAWYYRADPLPLALTVLGLIGSSAMGYARAKGEALGVDPDVGWMQRQERAAILGTFVTLSPVLALFLEPGSEHPRQHLAIVALALVAVFTNVTALWRAGYVLARLPGPAAVEPKAEPPATPVLGDERGHAA